MKIPRARFQFGQSVFVHWKEAEFGITRAVVSGLRITHGAVEYTVAEENGIITDGIDEGMLAADGGAKLPEGCSLVAVHTGDGWLLEVQSEGAAIAFLAWPENWPATMTTAQLEAAGFEVP